MFYCKIEQSTKPLKLKGGGGMTAFKCDRCKQLQEGIAWKGGDQKFIAHYSTSDNHMYKYDLCDDCYRQLLLFLNMLFLNKGGRNE